RDGRRGIAVFSVGIVPSFAVIAVVKVLRSEIDMKGWIGLQHVFYDGKGMLCAQSERHIGLFREIGIDVHKGLDDIEIVGEVSGKPAQYFGGDGKTPIAEKIFSGRDLRAEMIGLIAI